jgi:hypothetical protein
LLTKNIQTARGPTRKRSFNRLFGLSAALIAVVAVICALLYDIEGRPEILLIIAQRNDPLVLPFSVHNPAPLLAMKAVRFECVMHKATTENGISVKGLSVDQQDPTYLIPAGGTKQYECPFGSGFTFDSKIQSSDATVRISFRIFRIPLAVTSDHFVWTGDSDGWALAQPQGSFAHWGQLRFCIPSNRLTRLPYTSQWLC